METASPKDLKARLAELAKRAPALEIVTEGEALAARSHDFWVRSLMERRRDGGGPVASALVRPSDAADVASLLAWADEARVPIVPYGLGSGVCGAVLASPGEVVVDLGRMSRLTAVDEVSLTATVEPGMRGSDFEEALRQRGYTMGHWPQSIAISSVGGWCATRASGQLSTLYGNIEQMLLGCEVILPGGRRIRMPSVPRAATGPDLRHIFLGSEGTLGIFTELVFRIHPRPEKQVARAFTMPSVDAGLEVLRQTLRAGWTPAVTRLYDATEAGRNFAIPGGEGRPVLLLLSEGPGARVDAEAVATERIALAEGGIDRGDAPVSSWLEHRNEVPSFDSLLDKGLVVDTIEVAIGWDRIPELFRRVVAEGGAIPGMLAMSGHVSHCYTQGANIYFTFVAAESDPNAAIALYDRAWNTTLSVTHELGGTVAHHHGIGRVRKTWLGKELGAARELLVALKRALDPNGIMNPGVLVDLD